MALRGAGDTADRVSRAWSGRADRETAHRARFAGVRNETKSDGGTPPPVSRSGAVLTGQPGASVQRVSGMALGDGPPMPVCPPADLHGRLGAAGYPRSRSGI
jgi:hypothetical protein